MGVTARIPGWRAALSAYLASQAHVPFAYGHSDCATFAAGAITAMTGEDLRKTLGVGDYRTLADGLRQLREIGYESHIDLAASLLPEIAPQQAGVGDIAAVDGDGGLALGVVVGEWIVVKTDRGLGHVPLSAARRAWKC